MATRARVDAVLTLDIFRIATIGAVALRLLALDGAGRIEASQISTGQTSPNVDESKVNDFVLPDPLVFRNGDEVKGKGDWLKRRREMMQLFQENVYGHTPVKKLRMHVRIDEEETQALDGKARRTQLTMTFGDGETSPRLHLLLYVPSELTKKAPVFVGLNFSGNQTVSTDAGIVLNPVWVRDRAALNGYALRKAGEETRGSAAGQWQVERIVSRGYALATMYCGDIEPDFVGGMKWGVRPLFFKRGQTEPAVNDWGALGAWAWGLSRVVDVLVRNQNIDAGKIAVMGHSRLGKATLWAGAEDARFRVVISNESGKGGASLVKRNYGETVEHLNHSFPHWFAKNYAAFNDRSSALPVDGNLLLALIAPRALYVASAEGDRNSDPRGEFLAAVDASRVYELLGKRGIGTKQMPDVDQPVGETVRYHVRTGKHDVTAFDWEQYLAFADRQFQ